MMTKMRAILSLMVFSAFFLSVALPGNAANMKLLTPEVGWVLHSPGLMWTTDGGAHWKNITPPPASAPAGAMIAKEHIASVFFLNTLTGWALLSGPENGSDQPHFDLAATNDGGATWSVTPVMIPELNPRQITLAGSGQVDFVDSLHGWMELDVVSSANFRLGLLLATEDGGETWIREAPGAAGSIRFLTANDGWLAGGPDNIELRVTHDGGQNWQEVSLKPPVQIGAAIHPTYYLPVFVEGGLGFLPVNYSGAARTPSKLVIYSTDDGGRTWIPGKVLAESRRISLGQVVPVAVADSVLIVPAGSRAGRVTLATIPLRGEISSSVVASPFALSELSFSDSTHGWVVTGDGKLLATSDGGATWDDITPHPPRKPFPPASPRKWGPIDPVTGKPTGPGKPQAAATDRVFLSVGPFGEDKPTVNQQPD